MKTNKLKKKLEEFFDFSKKKQKKKRDRFLKIVSKLERKRSEIDTELVEEGRRDDSSKRYDELNHELKVITKLIKKAGELARSS